MSLPVVCSTGDCTALIFFNCDSREEPTVGGLEPVDTNERLWQPTTLRPTKDLNHVEIESYENESSTKRWSVLDTKMAESADLSQSTGTNMATSRSSRRWRALLLP